MQNIVHSKKSKITIILKVPKEKTIINIALADIFEMKSDFKFCLPDVVTATNAAGEDQEQLIRLKANTTLRNEEN